MALTPKAATSRIFVGPHNVLVRQGITFNDRLADECYWVEDFNGFERPDLRLSSEESPQDDGETALPSFRGGRTMSLTGEIRAGSYTRLMEMGADLEDSLIDLLEHDMVIKVQPGSPYFQQPDVQIACRATDWNIDKKIKNDDSRGLMKRTFAISFRASKPRYLAVATKQVVLVPTVASLTFPGGGGGLTFPGGGGGLTFPNSSTGTAINLGNWSALPVIRFSGTMSDVILSNDNGQTMKIKGSISSGTYIEVDVAAGTVVDQTGDNSFDQFDMTSDWLQLEGKRSGSTGINNLTLNVGGLGSGAQVTLTYKDSSM